MPDTAGRYYVLQFVDAWTNNFAYVGQRATGTGGGDFLLVPPGWDGDPPAGATVIRVPTTVASIVGRWACAGDDDLPAVHALQDATTLTPAATPAAPRPGSRRPTAACRATLVVLREAADVVAAVPARRRATAPLQAALRPARAADASVALRRARSPTTGSSRRCAAATDAADGARPDSHAGTAPR